MIKMAILALESFQRLYLEVKISSMISKNINPRLNKNKKATSCIICASSNRDISLTKLLGYILK